MATLELEFGGGLGDVFVNMYNGYAYNALRNMGPDDTAVVHLITHNPVVPELFETHPKREQFVIRDHGYWGGEQDAQERALRGIPPGGMNQYVAPCDGPLEYFPTAQDETLLAQVRGRPYLVLAAGAGLQERVLPLPLLRQVVTGLRDRTDLPIIAVGRTFEDRVLGRQIAGRSEPLPPSLPDVYTWIDQLSLPGTCQLVQQCAGLITAHSALCLMGWFEDKPELLLLPQQVHQRHIRYTGDLNPEERRNLGPWTPLTATYGPYMFGAGRETTTVGMFETYLPSLLDHFLRSVHAA